METDTAVLLTVLYLHADMYVYTCIYTHTYTHVNIKNCSWENFP